MALHHKILATYGFLMIVLFPLNYIIDKVFQKYSLTESFNLYILNIKNLWVR